MPVKAAVMTAAVMPVVVMKAAVVVAMKAVVAVGEPTPSLNRQAG
jgi:hypothetical protein